MDFTGTLMRGGRFVLTVTAGTLTGQTKPGVGPVAWGGTFSLPPGGYLSAGAYTLWLDDGRSGDILLGSGTSDLHQPALVCFTGSGMLL